MPLKITIASYGSIGKTCSALLQQDGFLNDKEASKHHQVTWMDLDTVEHRKTAEASTAGADIVLIIGNNTSGDPALAAVYMAMCCAEKRISCYALLCLPAEPKKSDPLLISLRNRASNTLLITQDRVPNSSMADYLAKAVLNMLHPITGEGMIGVDFADIKTVLGYGKNTAFAVSEASGEDRAALAAQAAVAQLPDISIALSMLCNITCGFDLKMEEWVLIGDIVREQAPNDCVVVCSTTLNPDWKDGWIQAGITVCMKKENRIVTPDFCPACGSNRAIGIRYDMDMESFLESQKTEPMFLSGSCIVEEDSPLWTCNMCKHVWGKACEFHKQNTQ